MKNYTNSGSSGPIKAGTTILVEKPFAFILSSKEQRLRCDHCFTKGKVLKCSGCQQIHYCGRSCQKDAWPEHKEECKGYKKIFPRVPPDAARLLARLIRKLAKGGGFTRGHYTEKSFRVWKDLMSHYHDLKVDSRRMEHFTSLCAVLFEFLTDITLPNSVELMGIYGRMCINGFTILDPEMLSVGTGVYLGVSILDHSCEPNAVAVFDGTTINIRTLVDMPALDFSKVFISYIDLLNSPFERQTELLNTYYFLCQCERCLDNHQISLMHAAQCPNSKCDYPLQVPWREDIKLFIAPSDSVENEHDSKYNSDSDEEQLKKNSDNFQKMLEDSRKSSKHEVASDSNHDESVGCLFKKSSDDSCGSNGITTKSNGYTTVTNGGGKFSGDIENGHANGIEKSKRDIEEKFNSLSLSENHSKANTNFENGHLSQCPKCNTIVDNDFVKKFKETMDFTHLHLQNMKNKSITYVDVCRACLDRQKGVLHPLSLYHVQTLDLAMDGCIQYEFWEQGKQYAKLLLPGFKNYYGLRHPMYGLLLMKLGKLQLFAEESCDALVSLRAAAEIVKITHGQSSVLWRESLAPLMRQAEAEARSMD